MAKGAVDGKNLLQNRMHRTTHNNYLKAQSYSSNKRSVPQDAGGTSSKQKLFPFKAIAISIN